MRPPICEVCGRRARATVGFADYKSLPDGMVGHPRGLGWFCAWHLPGARRLTGWTMGEAVRRLEVLTGLVLVTGVFGLLGLAAALFLT